MAVGSVDRGNMACLTARMMLRSAGPLFTKQSLIGHAMTIRLV